MVGVRIVCSSLFIYSTAAGALIPLLQGMFNSQVEHGSELSPDSTTQFPSLILKA